MAKMTRDLFRPYLSINQTGDAPQWLRIDKSTQFEFSWNPSTEEKGYITDKNDATEVSGYAPELPEELALDTSSPLFTPLHDFLWQFNVGQDAQVPFLLVLPDASGEPKVGYMWASATLTGDTLNSVDGVLSFTIAPNGDPVKGTVEYKGDVPSFTAATASASTERAKK